ncbi:MAG TPA: hypothetical protein VEF76_12835 [Patescibacteria group bacterium]|nr:hypothetical protein [Patescibacteria group bacterium]
MPASNDDQNLRDTLNRLAQKDATVTERETARGELAAFAGSFNAASSPTAQALVEALPFITDYGSRWIAARMLRDAALKDPELFGGRTPQILYNTFAGSDAGSRYMVAGLIRDIGFAQDRQAVPAAAAIATLLATETDAYAKSYQKDALLGLALKNEATASIAVDAIAKLIVTETDSYARVAAAQNLGQLGATYPSQATAAIKALQAAALHETDGLAAHKIAENIASIALTHTSAVPVALTALQAGFAKGGRIESLSGNANALARLAVKHPAAVATILDKQLQEGGTRDQRRLAILNLKTIAQQDHTGAAIATPVLLDALKRETEPLYRRHIADGLMAAVENRIEPKPVLAAFKAAQEKETDRETRDHFDRAMRRLGYVRPYAANVLKLQPA